MEIIGYLFVIFIAVLGQVIKGKLREEAKGNSIVGTLLGSGRANTAPTGRVEPPKAPAAPKKGGDLEGDRGRSHYFSADERGEGHVASVGLSRERQLEQIKTWLEAGLIDEAEYKQRKEKIKRG